MCNIAPFSGLAFMRNGHPIMGQLISQFYESMINGPKLKSRIQPAVYSTNHAKRHDYRLIISNLFLSWLEAKQKCAPQPHPRIAVGQAMFRYAMYSWN